MLSLAAGWMATVWMVTAFPLAAMEPPPPHLSTAIEAQSELVRSEPRNPVAQNDLGNLLTIAGRFAEAEVAYRQAVEVSPADPAPRFNLALLLQQTGRAQKAQTELEALLTIAPDHAWAHYQLGVLAAAKRSREKALNYYAQALALDPGLSFASNNPHILDNPLFGEALLRSQHYREKSTANVPRQYGEAQRIIDLMLAKEETTAKTAEPKDEEEAPDGEPQETGASEEGRPTRPAAGAPDPTDASPTGDLTPTRSLPVPTRPAAGSPAAGSPVAGSPGGRGLRETPPRSHTAGSPSVPLGQPGGRAAADQPSRITVQEPTSGRRLRQVPPFAQGEASPPSAEGAKPDPPRSRYIPPSRRSTAQLDLKLLPEETAG